MRWHHLLRGGRLGLLSLEEQRGSWANCVFSAILIDLIGPGLQSRHGRGHPAHPRISNSRLSGRGKARRGASKPHVQISSEDQLADVPGCRLFLVVSPIDAVVKPQTPDGPCHGAGAPVLRIGAGGI
jgi:hypothetical protein